MIAAARLVAAPGGRIPTLRSEPPLTLRPTPTGVFLVGSAAGPLGGDDLRIEIEVEAGATLTVRSAAASVALPGPGPGRAPSRVTVTAHVADHAQLWWLVEPTIAARGCRHHLDATISLAPTAQLVWFEELVLGRYGEAAGSISSSLAIDLGGQPLLRHELALGPDHPSGATPAVAGDARAVGTAVVVGAACDARLLSPTAAVLPLDGPAFQVVALGPDRTTVRRLLDEGVSLGAGSVPRVATAPPSNGNGEGAH